MSGKVIEKNGWKKLFKEIKRSSGLGVNVGIVDGGIATYAAANEFGTRTIPSRPFMRSTFDERQEFYNERFSKFLRAGKAVRGALVLVALIAVSDIRKKIASRMSPANAQSTAEAKGEDNTLINTGTMRKAITYEVVTMAGNATRIGG